MCSEMWSYEIRSSEIQTNDSRKSQGYAYGKRECNGT